MRRHGTRNFYCIIIIFLYISLCRIVSSEFQVYELKTYNDGTILVHLVSDAESTELNCRKPILYFKILHPNGIIDSINLNVTGIIPDFNFCKTRIGNVYDNYIKVHPLTRGTIFIMYINSTDFSSASVYGLLISWKGEIISSTFLKEAIFQNKIVLSPGSLYFPRNRDITSFIYVTSQPDTSDIIWSLFTLPIPTNNRTINLIREGFIKNDGGSFVNFVAFLTAAGDYCLVVARSYTSNTSNTLSSTPMLDITLQIHLKVEAYFIYTIETENTVPSIIYMSAIENLNVFAMNCDIEYSGLGNMCQLYFVNGLGVSTFPFTLSIVFHSSGSVGTAVSNDLELDIKATDYLVLDPLYYQGDLLTIHRPQETGNFIYGYILNATGHVVSNWTIPQPLQTNSTGNIYGILPDNIITYAMQNGVSNWTLNFEKLPEFTMLDDNGYFNPQINSTFPPINGTIPIRTNEIIINYKQAVTLSDGNISVFQLQDLYGDSLLRQTYSGNSGYCNVTADSLTIKCYILESTFNQQNTEYYVLVDPNFVRLNSTEEPLLGIEKLVWKFKSNMTVTESYSATIQSIIRLDTLASARFENLTTDGKVEFVNQLNHELAVCVPVDAKRFYSEAAYQYDPSIVEKRILLPLTIFNAPINSSMIENSTDVFGDLNVLIRNSNLTLISRMNKTKSLDPSFGIIRAHDLWNDYYYIIVGFIGILIIMILAFFACFYKDPDSEGAPVLKFILSAISLILNILFTAFYAQAVKSVYISSVVILIASTVLKEAFGLYLIRRERNSNSMFFNWWRKHLIVGRIFTLLSFVDIYSLEVLCSKIGNSENLSAPFTRNIKVWIYWIGFVAFFKKDLSQLVLLVIYYSETLHNDLIPLLSLIAAAAVVIFNGFWRIYLFTMFLYRKFYKRDRATKDNDPSIVIYNTENNS